MDKPFIIGIGGTHSGVGKTTLAVSILRHFTSEGSAITAKLGFNKWGAIKYTNTTSPPLIVDDSVILAQAGKDTSRMLKGGASQVLWVKSPPSVLHKVLPDAIKRLSGLDAVVVEGNSAIEFLKPDIVLFISAGDKNRWKSGIQWFLSRADIILYEDASGLSEIAKGKRLFNRNLSDRNESKVLSGVVSLMINKKRLKEEMYDKAVDGKISCAAAMKIAKDLGISYAEVGAEANELGIKIKNCQLGCF
ncbi:MAG: hypothetical protein AB1632_01985 [Nitrospirota bacterium]